MEILNDKDIIRKLGLKIKFYRKLQNITQSQLAFEANIPRVQVGRIERGEINTTVKTITAIANVFNLKPKDLFDFEVDN